MSNALRTALDYVAQDQQQRAHDIEAVDAKQMGSLRRGYEAGRIGTDVNANLIDEAGMRSSGRDAEADALAQRTQALQRRQAMYAPDVGRVEDIGGLRDALSWAGTQVGQGAASMQDPVALSAAGTALGRVPGLKGIAPLAGMAGAFMLNQRQMAGEHYGNIQQDPAAMGALGAQGAYQQANAVGVAGGALDTVLPGLAGRALGGAALRKGVTGTAGGMPGVGFGAKTAGGMLVEGTTEVGQGEIGRAALAYANPYRDTSEDDSNRINEFAGGAVGGAPFSAAGAAADAGYSRVGRAGELVKEKSGEVVDLASQKAGQVVDLAKDAGTTAKDVAGKAYEDSGIKGVVDLGIVKGKSVWEGMTKAGRSAQDYMRDEQGKINYVETVKRAQADVERFKMSREEADLLNPEMPDDVAQLDPGARRAWTDGRDAKRLDFVTKRLADLENEGADDVSGMLDALTGDDPVAQVDATAQASAYLLERNAAAQADQQAALFQASIGEFIQGGAKRITRGAKAAGGAAVFTGLNVAEGVKQGLVGSKKNLQGASVETLDYDTWKSWRDQNALPVGEDTARAHSIQKAVEGRSRAEELAGEVPIKTDPVAAARSLERATLFAEIMAAEAKARRTRTLSAHRADEQDGVIDYTNYVRSLAYEVSDMAESWASRAAGGTRPTGRDVDQAGVAMGVIDGMANDLRAVLGDAASDIVARMAEGADPTTAPFFSLMQERVATEQDRSAETPIQDQILALMPQEHQAALLEGGGAGAKNLMQTVQMISRGRVGPGKRREIEDAIGADKLNQMLAIYGGTLQDSMQVGTLVDDVGNEEIQNADGLTVTDDGEVDPNSQVDDFEKRQAERKTQRNSAPRMFAFYGEKAQSIRTTDSESRRMARNPFEPINRVSPAQASEMRAAALEAELLGEGGKPVIPNARPRLLRMDAEGAKEGISGKVQQLEKSLGVDRTPENFFRLAEKELRSEKGVAAAAKARDGVQALTTLRQRFDAGDEQAQAEVQDRMDTFFQDRAGDYVVDAVSAKQVMDELGMPPSQRLAIFRDYMFQEAERARKGENKDEARAQKFYALARSAQAQLLDGGLERSNGAAGENANTPMRSGVGTRREVKRLTAGERRTLMTAMDRYLGEGYLVAGQQLSDRVPGTMAVGELMEMARGGNKAREAVRGKAALAGNGAVAETLSAELEGTLLNFPQREGVNLMGTKGNVLPVKASSLVAWVRNNRREEGADTKADAKTKIGEEAQFLRDLQEGITAVANMDAISGMPYVLGPKGEQQFFTDRGVPAALALPNRTGKSFNKGKAERVKAAAGKDAPEPSSNEQVAMDQARGEDWFTADPLEGAVDEVSYTTRGGVKESDLRAPKAGEKAATRARASAVRSQDALHAPVNRQRNRDDEDVSPLDTKLFLGEGQAEYDDQKMRSKDAGAGVGRESSMGALKQAPERAASVVAYKGAAREVTQGGVLARVDRDIDARGTLTNIQYRLTAARLSDLRAAVKEGAKLSDKEVAIVQKYAGNPEAQSFGDRKEFAAGKHYAYPLAYALSVKNVQSLLDSGAFSPAQADFLINQQRMAAQLINSVPMGPRLELAKAMMDGREDVRNYGQASAALAALAKGINYKRAAPEVAAAGAPKSQTRPGGARKLNAQGTGVQTQSAAFKRWFGDSRVVDKQGEPLVMYHGTQSDFNAFRSSSQTRGLLFVTDKPEVANGYAIDGGGWKTMGNAEDKVNLDLFLDEFPDPTDADFDTYIGELPYGVNSVATMQEFLEGLSEGANVMPLYVKAERPMGSRENPIDWREAERMGGDAIRARGYDSVWVTEQGGTALAVLGPTQLKSATGNNGAFDPAIPDVRRSAQGRAAQGTASAADIKAAREYFDRVLGKQVKAEFEDITGYSGEWIETDNLIKVSTLTNAGVLNVARHEAFHAFFSKFIKANPKAVKVLSSLTDDPRVMRRLRTLLKDEPAALQQLTDGEERLAYIYQFAMAGQLKLPNSPGATLMHKVRKFLRRVFQMVSDQERAVDLLYAFERGDFRETKPSAAARALAKTLDQGTWMKQGTRSIDAITQRAAAMVLPANTILAESASPTARELARMFFTNPGEDGAGEGGPGYLNDRNQQMRRYDNLFRKAVGNLDKGQLDALTETMQNETPTDEVSDPDVADAKEQLHALFARFYRYLTDEKGLRVKEIKESYFPVVYDVDKVRDEGMFDLLVGKYRPQIQKMAAAINAKRDKGAKMVSDQDVARAIVDNITRVNPLDDAELDPQREDGVLRPWFASGEKRVLNFLDPEDRAKFQEKDIVKTLSRYVRQGVRTAEYASRFGRTGKLLDEKLAQIKDELEAASKVMLAGGDLKDEKAREKWAKRQYRDVANAAGGMEGSLGNDVSETVRKINSWSIVYQNVRLLPLALFSSFVDPLGIVARGGEMREAFTTFADGMKGVARQWADMIRDEPVARRRDRWEELAEHAGVIDSATFSHLLADEYGSVYLDGTAKRINEVMFKANGMEAWNRAMRVGATRSAVRFMERHNKGGAQHSKRWMRDLGFEVGELPLDADGRLITDKRVLLSESPDMPMAEAEATIAKVHTAITRWVEGAVLSPNAAQRPAWGSDPHYSMFWHLKQFAYSFHETIMKRALNEARHGNVMPLGVFAWYIPTMIAADVTKGLMLGAGELPAYMKSYDLGDWMLHGVDRAGVLGVGQLAIDGVQEPLGLSGPMTEQITDIFFQPMEENIVKALPVNALYSRAIA